MTDKQKNDARRRLNTQSEERRKVVQNIPDWPWAQWVQEQGIGE